MHPIQPLESSDRPLIIAGVIFMVLFTLAIALIFISVNKTLTDPIDFVIYGPNITQNGTGADRAQHQG